MTHRSHALPLLLLPLLAPLGLGLYCRKLGRIDNVSPCHGRRCRDYPSRAIIKIYMKRKEGFARKGDIRGTAATRTSRAKYKYNAIP